jgi:hypothetical protein
MGGVPDQRGGDGHAGSKRWQQVGLTGGEHAGRGCMGQRWRGACRATLLGVRRGSVSRLVRLNRWSITLGDE